MHARKLILTALLGGPIVGALTGVAIDPTMSPAPEPSWRKLVENTYVPKPITQIVEVGPQDLSPLYTTMRDRILARRYLDAAAYRRDASYGYAAVAADPPRG